MDGGGIGGRGCLDWEIILIGGMREMGCVEEGISGIERVGRMGEV